MKSILPSSRRLARWSVFGALIVLIALLISGCGGPPPPVPLSAKQFQDLGREMAAIERMPREQLVAVANLTPAKIEFIEALSPEQIAKFSTLTAQDVSQVRLGENTAVVANLTPAQIRFIQNLNNAQLGQLSTLTDARLGALDAEIKDDKRRSQEVGPQSRQAYSAYWAAYIAETRAELFGDPSQYAPARAQYEAAAQSGGGYGAQARYRLGVLGIAGVLGEDSTDIAKTNLQIVSRSLKGLFSPRAPEVLLWVREPALAAKGGPATVASQTPPSLRTEEAPTAATAQLDILYKNSRGWDHIFYIAADRYVAAFRALAGGFGAALSLIVLALLIKLVTIPLTNASFRGMRDMQRVQPMIKELQEKYKNDRQKLAEEQMKLMKEHKVSPLGGCLPMLIQLPIFLVVYRAVQVYAAGFANAEFLWIHNLAQPDTLLLILYAVSMVLTQKLTATPATDPQQKMMQTQMTYFMPIFLLFVLGNIASAFVLYWFFLNVFSSIHQYYLLQQFKKEDEARGIVTPAAQTAPTKPGAPKKKGK